MSKIFSGDSSKDFWRAIRKAQIDILYDYGCKAQEIEQQRDDLLEACEEYSKGIMLLRESNNEIMLGAALQLQKADDLCIAAIAKATHKS